MGIQIIIMLMQVMVKKPLTQIKVKTVKTKLLYYAVVKVGSPLGPVRIKLQQKIE